MSLRRREFIAGLGGAAAWPLAARAQQPAVIGYLDYGSLEARRDIVAAVLRGLAESATGRLIVAISVPIPASHGKYWSLWRSME